MKDNIDPRMHSAEHLLNQTMVRLFGCDRCFRAHIEKKKSKCDYHFARVLTDEEIKKIEQMVNQIIQTDLPIFFELISLGQAKSIFGDIHLPEIKNQVRIVKIGDYDAIPCIGNHINSTKEIGVFKIVSTDFNNGVLRIRYKLK